MSYSYAILVVSAEAFKEIRQLLDDAGYSHAFDGDLIDMHGIALKAAEGGELFLLGRAPRPAGQDQVGVEKGKGDS